MVRVAAVDCGTNSLRLLIADVRQERGRWRVDDLHRETRIVRLGEGVDATGTLAPQALDRVWLALSDYAAAVRTVGAVDVHMVATSAVRDADNADEFTELVRSTLRVTPQVLSGADEAELGFLGTVNELDGADGGVAVIDVGGGSTELVMGAPASRDGRIVVTSAASIDTGAVRLTERTLRSDPPTRTEREAAELSTVREAALACDAADLNKVTRIVAVAGTALTVAAGALRRPLFDPASLHLQTVPLGAIDRTTDLLLNANRAHRASLGWVIPGRVDVIGAGALILRSFAHAVADRIGAVELTVSTHDLLDGAVIAAAGALQ